MLKTVSFHARAATAALAVLATFALSAQAAPRGVVSSAALKKSVAAHRADVPEFQFIREQAKALGIRVWLFGGTAAGYGHYVKWNLQRESGDDRFQADRFDFDYTNIYRSTQDADLVVDGPPEAAAKLNQALAQRFPHLQGSKSAWEVRLLKQAVGAKDALLDNPDYLNQHTDSNSTGMIELTDPPTGESVIRDLRDWKSAEPIFLKDLAAGELHYYFSKRHKETARAKSGDNPEIFSAVRLLTKAFQYELTLRPEDWAQVQAVIDRFDPKRDLTTPYSQAWLEKNAKKLIQHAVNIEYAWDTLEKLGLRKKLIALKNDAGTEQSLAWWLSKEPLRDGALGTKGLTARELFAASGEKPDPIVLAHETNSFLAYESITRAHTGDPNILISRMGHAGEAAKYGDGFYTRIGRVGGRNTGRTIRFTLDPDAREGEDFIRAADDYIVILNKRAIRVIPESLQMSLPDYLRMLAEGKSIDGSDLGILEKLKRRLNAKSQALSTAEANEIFAIAEDHLASEKPLSKPFFGEFFALVPGIGQRRRIDWMVDELIDRRDAAATIILGDKVLSQPWSANRPRWYEALAQSRTVAQDVVISNRLALPHWRLNASAVEASIARGEYLDKLVSEVLVPYWQGRPKFRRFISAILAKGEGKGAIGEYVLSQPAYADRFDWLQSILLSTSFSKPTVVKGLLARPHWANQAKVVQEAIDLDYDLPNLMTEVLIPYWWNRPEFPAFVSAIVEKGTADGIVLGHVLVDPKYAKRFDWLEAILKRKGLNLEQVVEKILTLPHWRDQERVMQLAIDLDYDLPRLTEKILVPHWKDRPELPALLSAIVAKGTADGVVAGHFLTRPAYADRIDWLEAILRRNRVSQSEVVERLLARPHWRDQVKAMQLAIDLDYSLPKLAEEILIPYWKNRPEFPDLVSAILKRNDASVHLFLANQLLFEPASGKNPEWFEAILHGRHLDPRTLVENLLTLPHWRKQLGPVLAAIHVSMQTPGARTALIEKVIEPYWKSRPEFGVLLTDMFFYPDQSIHDYARLALVEPSLGADAAWVHAWIDSNRGSWVWLYENVLKLPHWQRHPELAGILAKMQSKVQYDPAFVQTLADAQNVAEQSRLSEKDCRVAALRKAVRP